MVPVPLRRSRRDPATLRLAGDLSLRAGRVHELCGPARWTAAAWAAAGCEGPVIWITVPGRAERLHGPGLAAIADPGRVIFVDPRRAVDALWSAEEALRAGVVPLVVADLAEAPALTPVRRLTLAAEAGAAAGPPPTALLLTPGPGGAPGVESRWHLAPRHRGERRAWHLERRRARLDPPAEWRISQAEGQLTATPARAESAENGRPLAEK